MNLKFIDWKTESIKRPENIKQMITSNERESSEMLLDFVNRNLLVQTVTENTRKDKSIIDLVFTSDDDIVFNTTVEKTNLDTDHDVVKCQILHKQYNRVHTNNVPQCDKKLIDKLNFKRADWIKIRADLSTIKWSEVLTGNMSVDNMYNYLDNTISSICAKYTPERMRNDKFSSIPRNRLVLIRKRKKINSRINFLKYVSPAESTSKIERLTKKKFDLEEQIKILIKAELQKKEIDAVKLMRTNPKFFYTYVKKFQKTESRIGPLKDEDGNLNANTEVKANLLQSQYTKVSSNPENINTDKVYTDKCNVQVEDISITVKDILNAIKEIPTHAAPGPDKLPAMVLKECANDLAEAILIIWRKSLDTGQIPDTLKHQIIIPLYKKGNRALPENYRPVSLTSHLIKLFERVLRKNLIKHLEDNNLLSDNQHAFRSGRSCLSQQLQHMDNILATLEEGMNIDVVYLDFSKAFDKVDHKILMKKVYQYGIRGKLHAWLKSFISNRYQQVMCDGTLSRKEKVISGVPQGTVLGPLLFLIYINDLEAALKHSILRIFADDSKIVKEIVHRDDHQKLQEDLNISIQWSEENNMELNKTKFQLIQYGDDENLKEPYSGGINVTLIKEPDIKDLGVYLSEDLSWETQTTEAVKKGRKYMGWILRSFTSRSARVIIPLYQTYVIPRVEYASILWSPHHINKITKLESIQRTVTSKIEGIQNLNYHQRLRNLKLYSMQRRRERFLAIYMFKIANGLVPNNLQLHFYRTRRQEIKCHQPKLKAQRTHLCTVRQFFFTCTGPAIFNLIPSKVKESQSLDQFKHQLDRFLVSIPDLPPTPGYPAINRNTLLEWVTGNYDYDVIINTLAENKDVRIHRSDQGDAVHPDVS